MMHRRRWTRVLLGACLLGHAMAAQPAYAAEAEAESPDILSVLRDETVRLLPWVESDLAREFLGAVERLPAGEARVLHRGPERHYYSATEAAKLGDAEREKLEKIELDAASYYTTKYGTPLAYVRALDLVGGQGLKTLSGARVLDFGYGTVGHLRLMALMGAEAVGVDVDSFLTALYSTPDDQGTVKNPAGRDGSVTLVDGRWPGDVGEAVGGGFDLFLSKNTLKRGYIHPEREVDPKRLVHLGVDEQAFVRAIFEALNPGGFAVIYNLSPPQNPPEEPYIPWADGRCPFDRALLAKVGFDILIYDREDSEAARTMGGLLGWGDQGMDLEKGLFGHVTVLRKPPKGADQGGAF